MKAGGVAVESEAPTRGRRLSAGFTHTRGMFLDVTGRTCTLGPSNPDGDGGSDFSELGDLEQPPRSPRTPVSSFVKQRSEFLLYRLFVETDREAGSLPCTGLWLFRNPGAKAETVPLRWECI